MAGIALSNEAGSVEGSALGLVVDRSAIRADLKAARTAYHRLMASITDEQWLQKSPSSDWTWREVMQHLAWAVEQLPAEIASARREKGMFNYPGWLANPVSYWTTRWEARNVTRESLLRRYDAAIDATLRALDEVPESDWAKSAPFYGHGMYTVAALFHTPAEHLAEHTVGLTMV
jgi:hypothetical protein